MLEVVAEAFDGALDLAVRRERYTCEEFSYEIAASGMAGIVMLLPQRRTLVVSSASVGYVQVRVTDGDGTPRGVMTLNTEGRVTWSEPDLAEDTWLVLDEDRASEADE